MTPRRSRIVVTIATIGLLLGVLWLGARRSPTSPCMRDGRLYSHGAYVRSDNGAVVCDGGHWVAR
jgi:hypothetical protein